MKLLFGISLFTAFSFVQTRVHAQYRISTPAEYHLQGVMETASALLLKPDSTFELYFSYGAMDRQGSGRWTYNDGHITLKSRPKPQTDFALVTSKATEDSSTIVRITSSNSQLLPHFEVMLRSATGENYGKSDAEGVFIGPKSKLASIELFFNFCPERFSTFPIQNADNYFEFRMEPWIAEIFADNIVLKVTVDGLEGQHPLLKGDSFRYTKAR
ncbi:hypothetical protein [Dyadobacter sp. 32]|uniref:hypothetical protein n=1 Tax=Dyadobacter sp. 32 TaxID=538966 RepID=UPI0011EE3E05